MTSSISDLPPLPPIEAYDDLDTSNVSPPSEITPAIATWLGWQAARRGRLAEGRGLVPPDLIEHYDTGTTLPEEMSVVCPAPEALRRRLFRALGGDPEPKKRALPLPIAIVDLVRRPDVGTHSRYDLTIARGTRRAILRDLVASDLLTYSRLRPIALDAGLVLAELSQGQGALWIAEVERAMASARIVPLAPEESDTGELIEALEEVMASAREWAWSEEDTYPRGIARITQAGYEGWTRGPLLDALRARYGRLSRVALSRALGHLGLARADWRIESGYLRVWARPRP